MDAQRPIGWSVWKQTDLERMSDGSYRGVVILRVQPVFRDDEEWVGKIFPTRYDAEAEAAKLYWKLKIL